MSIDEQENDNNWKIKIIIPEFNYDEQLNVSPLMSVKGLMMKLTKGFGK